MTIINQKEYAEKMSVSASAVSQRIKKNMALPGVKKIALHKMVCLIHYDETTDLAEAKKIFRKNIK